MFITRPCRTKKAMSSTGICSATKRRRLARLQTRHADGSHHADHHWYGVRLDTIQSRHSNDNYQTSQRKPQDISHQVHQICNSKRSWLCGGHHLTRQCMYGNCTQSNLFAKKNEKASSCEQRLLERNPHLSLWYRVHHEAI